MGFDRIKIIHENLLLLRNATYTFNKKKKHTQGFFL